MTGEVLERRYRRLLAVYPADHRAEYGDEMVGVLMHAGAGRPRPGLAATADLLAGAVRVWACRGARGLRAGGWAGVAAVLGLLLPWIMAVYGLPVYGQTVATWSDYGGRYWMLFVRAEPVLVCWGLVVALVLFRRAAAAAWAATVVTAAQVALLGWRIWEDGPHGGETGKVAAWLATALVATAALHATARNTTPSSAALEGRALDGGALNGGALDGGAAGSGRRSGVPALAALGPVGVVLAGVVVPLAVLAHSTYYAEDVVLPVDPTVILDRPLPLVPDGRLLVPVGVLVMVLLLVVARRSGTGLVLRALAVLTPLLVVLVGDGPSGVPGGDTGGRLVPLGLRWLVAPPVLVALFLMLARFWDRRRPAGHG